MAMGKKYSQCAGRLWEKLAYHRKPLDPQCIDSRYPFPWDQLVAHDPLAIDLTHQVQQEFAYGVSEWQCS
jgi:hypothetical protein